MNTAIEQAIKMAGSQKNLADLADLTQAAISILKNGRGGKPVVPRFKTAKMLSNAVGGEIEWHEFMNKQGDNEESHNGKESHHIRAGNNVATGAKEIEPIETDCAA